MSKKITDLSELLVANITADDVIEISHKDGTYTSNKMKIGVKDNSNPLNHDRYTDEEAISSAKTVKLDAFMAPDDTTTLDATEALHGLMPKADKSKLDDIEANADVTDAVNIASSIHGVAGKETPVDNDEIGLIDSANGNVLKKTLWSQIKATLKTYFDAIYMPAKEQGLVYAANVEIDWNLGATAYITLTDNITFTFKNPVGGEVYRLLIISNGKTVTWPDGIQWTDKTIPVLTAAAKDILTFVYINSVWYGGITTNFGVPT